ncbi:HAD family phosphatase [Fusobacterium perfoetens]|uniref:HAD family hydrolase n=1 Tax=Fusobacterium perfoetens TaxID=852 RepID=UPI0015A05D13|nr:HAD family phosphatase [Fusobacterium perfoetens]MCF2625126.1 HAD family phosphatase [Fusobacterium perfoetens]
MVKNIVFDLGNVLIKFKPEEFTEKNISEKYREDFYRIVFKGQEWADLDRGVLEYDEAVKIFSEKLPQCAEGIKKLFDNYILDVLEPIEENIEIMKSLKSKYKLYILSNFHYPAFDYIFKNWEFFKYFDGKTVSGHCKLLKPERKIYERLCLDNVLEPCETIFIDDTKINIEAAEDFGIKGIHLSSPELLKEKLKENNII